MPWRTRLNSSTNSSSLPSSEITRGSWRGWRPPQGSAPLSVNPCGIPWELQPGHVCLPRLLLARLGTGQDLGRSCVVPSARALVQSKEREFYCIPRNCSNSCGLAPAFSGSATNPPPERFAALAVGAGVRSSWRCLLSLCSVPALPSVPWPRRTGQSIELGEVLPNLWGVSSHRQEAPALMPQRASVKSALLPWRVPTANCSPNTIPKWWNCQSVRELSCGCRALSGKKAGARGSKKNGAFCTTKPGRSRSCLEGGAGNGRWAPP
ncbi:uncharacterized protein LOC126648051 isoform X8 [Myiozetetes cayanensis]|uniref:uncharacterized protein LOC126648051 isoform X8 n=1 Tax=Myiozetetes cayanensis TaxID=478635 RepID=UPI00215F67E5|nr:uncharacterized protein LOC126648051 isoform X8 [Myiozetetes cayanensis]